MEKMQVRFSRDAYSGLLG